MPELDNIKDLLHRRSDLSTFVHHFTRGTPADCEASILNMLATRTLNARTPYGMATHLDGLTYLTPATQRTVCFTDTPIEHSWMMVRDIAGRSWDFQPYGIVFSKEYARTKGCHPVWYVDAFGPPPSMASTVWQLIENYRLAFMATPAAYPLETLDVLRMAPFMEPRMNGKDFVWEREWRHRGDFNFESPANVVAVFAPEVNHFLLRPKINALGPEWGQRDVPILDPRWGTDKIIHALSKGT
ncbi:hypothetical protein D6M20_02580 (plasmid) [Rhodococcus qingshengii]|nr:hypothetical protein D6M20_02580 [Rhodococcus qingshengii]